MQQTDAALVKRGHDIVRCDWDRHPLTSTGGRVVTVAGRVLDTSTKQGEERDDAPLLSGGVVFLAPVEDDAGSGRVAVLAMPLNSRVRMVAGSLVLVRVGTQEQRPLAGTATHFHEPPYAIAGWIETRCLVPGCYVLQATMRGEQGEVDTAAVPMMATPVQRVGLATCRVTQTISPLHGWSAA